MLISNLHSSYVFGCGGELNQSGKGMEGGHGGSQRVVVEGHRGWLWRVMEGGHRGWSWRVAEGGHRWS